MAIRDVKPTRSELLGVKKKIAISRSGHKLLKMKRDGLILEFFNILDSAKEMKGILAKQYAAAQESIAIASAVEGSFAVKSASFALTKHPEIELESRNLMGVVVPQIRANSIKTPVDERGYGLIGTSPYINDAAKAYEELVESIIRAAEIETSMKKLLDEIEKTKRRVNALEFKVIPELQESERFIELRLEEMERENTFRLKRIKDKGERNDRK